MARRIEAYFQNISLTYYCPKLKKLITKEVSGNQFSGGEDECEICGSHGIITVRIECECKDKYHEIEINSW